MEGRWARVDFVRQVKVTVIIWTEINEKFKLDGCGID